MSFLAPFLLALSGFAVIPILLHLIRRKRIRILDFTIPMTLIDRRCRRTILLRTV